MNRKTKRWAQLGFYGVILASAACQDQDMQTSAEINGSEKPSQVVSKEVMGASSDELSVDQQIQGGMSDLANRIGVAVDTIAIKEARTVQWSSGAMGCPQPGMNYTQALVPGMRLILEADGTIYYYHGGRGSSLFNCPAELARAPAYGDGGEVM